MKIRALGNTGINVGVLGLGGIPIQRCSQEDALSVIEACQQEGIFFVDTARGYGPSEKLIGSALESLGTREKWFIATKSPAKDAGQMALDIQTSLSHLKVEAIDLYQCHFVKDLEQYRQITSSGGAYEALVQAKEQGKIRHIGITAHNKDVLLYAIESGLWETIQFPYNLVETQGTQLFERANALGIGILVMKPLAGGAITTPDLALRFIADNPHISVAIPGMDSVEQVKQNAAIMKDPIPLTEAESVTIKEMQEALGTQFCRRCGYCGPCPEGIDIPSMFTLEGYLTRYDLKEWAHTRYASLPKHADDCVRCGICETRCPYDLEIRDMLIRVADHFNTLK